MVVIEMENGKQIKILLDAEAAPLTVANFEELVRRGFYDGLCFHRVIPGFMIQGGDPLGNGMGGAEKNIKGEFAQNGVKNPLRHTRGVISMARAFDPNSASSQFFIMHADAPHLDGAYAAFGHVIEGMDAVDEIASVRTNLSDKPLVPQIMRRVTLVDDPA
jgi:peptidyl-prolyl cis-trans isomerase B (cyclophilin B)